MRHGYIILAAVLFWPSGARAQGTSSGTQCTVDGNHCWYVGTYKDIPSSVAHPSYCDPGWTLVQVGSASFPTSNVMKCAPVGDLRDPK